jgi:hypothetical protein
MALNFKKLLSGRNWAMCWYDNNPTQYSLNFSDGSQIWACPLCLARKGKVARFRRLGYLRPAEVRSLKISKNSLIKNRENLILAGGMKQ